MSSLSTFFGGTIQVLVLFICFYLILRQLRGKKIFWMLASLTVLLALFSVFVRLLHLEHLNYFLTQLLTYLPLILLVLFQPELRQALTHFMDRWERNVELVDVLDILAETAGKLAHDRIGAIIAVENKVKLADLIDNPVILDAEPSVSLLQTIFYEGTPLHDGTVVISRGRIASAAGWLKISRNRRLPLLLGSRHRAALGLSEESDAAVIVISEETGHISLAYRSVLMQELTPAQLKELVHLILNASRGEVTAAYRRISRDNDVQPQAVDLGCRKNLRLRQRLAASRFWPLGGNPFRRRR